jgi:hypothetical protein
MKLSDNRLYMPLGESSIYIPLYTRRLKNEWIGALPLIAFFNQLPIAMYSSTPSVVTDGIICEQGDYYINTLPHA